MIEYLAEQLAPLGNIYHRQMFGTDCLLINGKILAIINKDGDIFIKKHRIDDGDIRFSYYKQGKIAYLNYILIDNAIIDDGDELVALVKSFLKE